MESFRLHMTDIADLATPVAMHGALQGGDVSASDDMFELIVGIAVVIAG